MDTSSDELTNSCLKIHKNYEPANITYNTTTCLCQLGMDWLWDSEEKKKSITLRLTVQL